MSDSTPRRIDVFFYGLFMDEALLRAKGVNPTNPRLAAVDDFELVVGKRATLVPTVGDTVHGVVFSLTQEEIDVLYSDPSVKAYRPEPVLAQLEDGSSVPVLCFNIPTVDSKERNVDYVTKLKELATRLNLPVSYVNKI